MEKDEKQLIIGSRDSLLAVRQSTIVLDYLRRKHPEMRCELLTMKTTGDKILEKRLDQIGGKGLFVKELDIALRDGRTDLSVHSLKDMPAEIPEDLPVIGFSGREDPRDVLVLPEGISDIAKMDLTKPIGTSSRRRALQAQELFPRARFESVRGNVQTRLRKLDEGQYCALILAAAGLRRLGLDKRISRVFSVDELIPSAGQGILALQGRRGVDYSCLDGFLNERSGIAAAAERAFVGALGGGCTSPIAAHAAFADADDTGMDACSGNENGFGANACSGNENGSVENAGFGNENGSVENAGAHCGSGSGRDAESSPDRGPYSDPDRGLYSGPDREMMTLWGFYYDELTCRSYRKKITVRAGSAEEGRAAGKELAAAILAEAGG